MQISDALGRYNTNMTPGAPGGSAAVQKEQPAQNTDRTGGLSGLQAGQVFEGTVGAIKNGQVQLQLSNGATISARLGGNVPLQEGQSLFFEVKSNEGGTVEIKPFDTAGGLANPTILSALDAAGLSATPDHMKMVQTLMQEQMSIDKQSLGNMARLITSNPGIEPSTLIEMMKLGFPISDEMAAQFENYKTDSYQILNKMNEILESVTNTLGGTETSGKDALALNEKLIQILSGGETAQNTEVTGEAAGTAAAGETAATGNAGETAAAGTANAQPDAGTAQKAKAAADAALMEMAGAEDPAKTADTSGAIKMPDAQEQSVQQGKSLPQGENLQPENPDAAAKLSPEGDNAQKAVAAGTLRETLSKEEMLELVKTIKTLEKKSAKLN